MIPERKMEPVIEVFGNNIIGGEFYSQRHSIEKKEDPCSVIGDGIPKDLNIYMQKDNSKLVMMSKRCNHTINCEHYVLNFQSI